MHTFLRVVQIIVSIALIITVLKQPGKSDGFNLISSGSDTFYGKNKTQTYESFLAKLTIVLTVIFVVVTSALTIIG